MLSDNDKEGCVTVRYAEGNQVQSLVVLTVAADATVRTLQKASLASSKTQSEKATRAALLVTGDYTHDEWVQMIKTLDIADYRYDRYRTSGLSNTLDVGDDKDDFEREAWALLAETYPPNGESIVAEAETLAACVRTARNLVNTPANDMTPTRLADEAQRPGEAHDLMSIFSARKRFAKAHSFLNVAKGSREKPRFIVMRYKGNPHSDEVIALVGKGLTYDSGGYALKPGNSMATMFSDMSGSAAVMNGDCRDRSAENQSERHSDRGGL